MTAPLLVAAAVGQRGRDLDGVPKTGPDLNGDGLRMYRRVATMRRDLPYYDRTAP
jgi:hypothetical protein